MKPFELTLGTHNAKKRKELEQLLEPYPVKLRSLADVDNAIEVDETGTSFKENAILKAREQAKHLGCWVLGEDSGLSVQALDGAPGIYSARFSGEDATDQTNNALLLEKLKDVSAAKRTAWYTCHMALSDPQGEIHVNCEARCYGVILKKEFGDAGFGYDPLFLIPEYSMTFGQLGDTFKSLISHRARANRQFVPRLLEVIARQ
jgi:XTP/dITP diphosphohydrolase